MKPDNRFVNQPKHFWANVRSISQQLGYTDARRQIRVPQLTDMEAALQRIGLTATHLVDENNQKTVIGQTLTEYFHHRAEALNNFVNQNLMDVEQAKQLFESLQTQLSSQVSIPLNKQKGDKKAPAYFTAIINLLIERSIEGLPCNHNPRRLTTVTRGNAPLRTLARRVDGAFPDTVNPIAIWEIKEYYYTTTFGSRVADGVYETLLDGMELEELREHEKMEVKHYLMIDSHRTWWQDGKSYLCRIIDILHMGYVDEVLFGYEVIGRLPELTAEWVRIARSRE